MYVNVTDSAMSRQSTQLFMFAFAIQFHCQSRAKAKNCHLLDVPQEFVLKKPYQKQVKITCGGPIIFQVSQK